MTLAWDQLPRPMQLYYINQHMEEGKSNPDPSVATLMTFIYAIVVVIGIPSNLLTMVIIIYKRGGTMSPTDNFLMNLSVVDIFSLICSKFCTAFI